MINQISPEELKSQLSKNKNLILIDVRESWEYEITNIPGAKNIPLGQVPKIANEFPHDSEIVVYCHHGVRSMRAANFLVPLGFKNVRNLIGGIDNYRNVDETIKKY